MKLLIITYYWPPGSSPGVQRWLKTSSALIDFGCSVDILTVKNGSYPAKDSTLLEDVHADLRVFRTSTIEPFRLFNLLRGKGDKTIEVGAGSFEERGFMSRLGNYVRSNFFIPDARKGWVPFACRKAKKLLLENDYDYIITTGPPHSTHLIGLDLKKESTAVRWLADFRDPWMDIFYRSKMAQTQYSSVKERKMEQRVVQECDKMTVASFKMEEDFKNKRNGKIHIMLNGYDEKDFLLTPKVPKNDLFTISYIGNFKSSQNIHAMWKSLASVMYEKGNDLLLHLVGNQSPTILKSIKRFNLTEKTKLESFLPHIESIKRMQGSNLLLLPIPLGKDSKTIVTGKIFEYLASRTPILAIGPADGDASKILQTAGRSPAIEYTDITLIQKRILQVYEEWKNSQSENPKVTHSEHSQFSRRHASRSLLNYLNDERNIAT